MSPRKVMTGNGTASGKTASGKRKWQTKVEAGWQEPAYMSPERLAAAEGPINQAEAYGVRVVTAKEEGKVASGEKYWRLMRSASLT